MDEKSSGEKGTSFAEINRSSCSNAKKGPTKDYKAFQDFHESKTSAHVLPAWMQFSGMHKIESLKKVTGQQNFNSSIIVHQVMFTNPNSLATSFHVQFYCINGNNYWN